MKAVLIVVALTLLAANGNGQCPTPTYTQNIVPACNNPHFIMLPNYADLTTYYDCSTGTPVLVSCNGEYFSYVLQECTTCDEFIAPVDCPNLSIKIDCIDIAAATTPAATTAKLTTANVVTDPVTVTIQANTATDAPTTQPSSSTTEFIPGPPSAGDADVPTPPEDSPTPPIIDDEP